MENRKYKLYGTCNMYGVVPGEVYCVFIDEAGAYYFGFSSNQSLKSGECCYATFVPVPEVHYSEIRSLLDTTNLLENIEEYYQVGDVVIDGFEMASNQVYIGRLDNYIDYLRQFSDKLETDSEGIENVKLVKESIQSDLKYYGASLESNDGFVKRRINKG